VASQPSIWQGDADRSTNEKTRDKKNRFLPEIRLPREN